MSYFSRVLREVGGVGLHRGEVQGEVADHLRRRRHLRHPAEDPVGGGVHVLDELEVVGQAEGDRLLAQVRELPAGDLVVVHAAGRAGQTRLERAVEAAHGLPVRLEVADGLRARCRCRARCARAPRRAPTAEGWLVVPAIGALADVDRVDARARSRRAAWRAGRRRCRACAGAPAGRSARAARVTSFSAAAGPQEARHVLDREDVRAGVDDLRRRAAGSSRACRGLRRGRAGRRCSRAPPRRRRVPVASTASIAGRIWSTSFRASKMRKMSTPVAAASRTNASATSVGYGV